MDGIPSANFKKGFLMGKLLSNQEVELYIRENYLNELNKYLRETVELANVFFVEGNNNSQEGTHVYTNEKGYNYLFTEKGKVQKHEVTMELFKIDPHPILRTRRTSTI